MNGKEFSEYLYNNRLPELYRKFDTSNELKTYLSVLYENGMGSYLEDENNLTNIINPYLCPEKFLPTFCNCFGLDFYSNIPSKYHRKLLANIGELNRRRGTYNCIRYLCRVLTGMEIDYHLAMREGAPVGESETLYIDLKAETITDVSNIDTSIKVISLFILDFIPYYINSVIVKSIVNDITTEILVYRAGIISIDKEYTLPTNYVV